MRIKGKRTVTQEKAYWLLPRFKGKLQYEEVSNIDFSSSDKRHKTFEENVAGLSSSTHQTNERSCKVTEPSDEEQFQFLEELFKNNSKAVILSITTPFNKSFVPHPVRLRNELPKPLTSFKCSSPLEKTAEDIKNIAADIKISINETQAKKLEMCTRSQSQSRLWFQHRAGRTTSSVMKRVCATSLENPSISLIHDICYPDAKKINTPAIQWGKKNEKVALKDYIEFNNSYHEGFNVSSCGLHVHPEYPHVGATPDGIVNCTCCGTGCLEIKCPFTCRGDEGNVYQHACLDKSGNVPILKRTHEYYYQVQTHLLVTKSDYCGFIMWSSPKIVH